MSNVIGAIASNHIAQDRKFPTQNFVGQCSIKYKNIFLTFFFINSILDFDPNFIYRYSQSLWISILKLRRQRLERKPILDIFYFLKIILKHNVNYVENYFFFKTSSFSLGVYASLFWNAESGLPRSRDFSKASKNATIMLFALGLMIISSSSLFFDCNNNNKNWLGA